MGHSAFVIRTGPTALLRGSHGGSPDSGRRFAQNPAPFMASGRYLSSDTIDLDELRTRLRKIYESQRFSPFPKDSQPDSMRVGFENRRSTSNGALDTFSSVACWRTMFLHTRASRVFARDGITALEERTTLTSSLILLLKPMAYGGGCRKS
jgi:hypothetical protein